MDTDRGHIEIAGVGLVTPLGPSAWQTFGALLRGKTLTDRAVKLPQTIDPVDLVRAVGCVSTVQHSAADPAVELAESAAREALQEAGIKSAGLPSVLGSSKGAVHALTAAVAGGRPAHQQRMILPAAVRPVLPRDHALSVALGPHGYLSYQLRKRLELATSGNIVAACTSGLAALHMGRLKLLRNGVGTEPARMLIVTSEAALLPLFIYSYKRLGVLAPLNRDEYTCRPLDERARGFTLVEVGAAVVLERRKRPTAGRIQLLETAVGTETDDLVRCGRCMPALRRIAHQLLRAGNVDVIHPHATATADFDPVELSVYENVLGDLPASEIVDVYAAKGGVGHGLGAAGLVSLVIACLCARAERRPPMPWLTSPRKSSRIAIAGRSRRKPMRTHAVFAAGFGGHVAGALIQRAD